MLFSNWLVCCTACMTIASAASSKPATSKAIQIKPVSTTSSSARSTTSIAATSKSSLASPFVTILQSEVAHPSDFCNFYLSNGANQTLSASYYFSAAGLTLACQNVVSKVQKPSKAAVGTSPPVCDRTGLAAITKEFTKPLAFCQYWTASSQEYLPLSTFKSLSQVTAACLCVVPGPSAVSSSKSTTKTTAMTKSTIRSSSLSTTTTTATTRRTTTPAQVSSMGSHTHATSSTSGRTTPTTTSTTQITIAQTSSVPTTYSSPFYVRLVNGSSSSPFNGNWLSPQTYLQDNDDLGQYLAVTSEMPQNPFVLDQNNALVLVNGTLSGSPTTINVAGFYLSVRLFYLGELSSGVEPATWSWDRNTNKINMTDASSNPNYSSYHTVYTCPGDSRATREYTDWETSIMPVQPLVLGVSDNCVQWQMEAVPANKVVKPTSTTTTISTSTLKPTSIATTSIDGMKFSKPFYVRVNNNTNSNLSNYWMGFHNFTNGAGTPGMYLGLASEKPDTPFIINSDGILIQLNNTLFGSPGFAIQRDGNYDLSMPTHMSTIVPTVHPIKWQFNLVDFTISMHADDTNLDIHTFTCAPGGGDGYWNATMMAVPPILSSWQAKKGCIDWALNVVFA
ncbi:hypothetical protein K461DRAFT_318233 [Myriangium duriaei CBS 260.36]|uniref:Uncharacterized protein n=1 Tax=Myriangium duriaei CBS 260.36 TaxID=1168546 RepID=A0A9P4JAY9_9PEZI|nr:hypothetical protein K461DRAFT_318233 [Myriangium duriaei CBS 260.36]